jgi:outer membrane cobalamin receptor
MKYLKTNKILRSINQHISALNIGLLLCSLSISPQTQANTDEDSMFLMLSGDEELISIATGTPRPVSKAPAVASVITAQQILDSGANTLEEVLERVPGLHVITSAGKQQSPTYSFRGINTTQGPQTLFLVNGQEITFLMVGGLQYGLQFSLNSITRIEVIRGPGSAVYGADAFSGVINIITKTSTDINGIQTGVKTGSFGTQSVWGQYGAEHSGWQIAANIEYRKTDGDNTRIIDSDLQTQLDGALGTSASLAPGPMDTTYDYLMSNFTLAKNNWTLHFNTWNGESGLGAGIANALDSGKIPLKTDQYQFDVKYADNNWLPDWSLETRLSHLYADIEGRVDIFPDAAILPIGSDGNLDFVSPAGLVTFPDGYIGAPGRVENTTRFDITTRYSGWQTQVWRFNAGIKKEDFQSSESKNFGPGVINGTISPIDGTLANVTNTAFVYIPNKDRTISFLSVQDEWTFASDWQLIAGLRYDNYSDFGSTVNPRASVIWNTRHDLTSKLLYGRAFRAPSFAELYAQNNPIATGNPELDPEIINSLELAFDYKPMDTLSIIFNLFHYEIDGLIDFVDDDGLPGGDATAQNSLDQKADGFELEAKWQVLGSVRLFGSAAFQNATNSDSGEKIANAPRQQLHVGANWQHMPKWNSQLDAYAIMDRPRAPGDPREPVDDYNWVNLSIIGREILLKLSVQFSIKNLFDTDAREPGPVTIANDYPLEGRSAYLGISYQF